MVVRGVVIMLDITEMKKLLKASLPHKRFKHSLAVYDTALELAAVYGLDKEKVGVGALLHDCGREMPNWAYITPGKNTALPIRKFWMLSVFILLVRQA